MTNSQLTHFIIDQRQFKLFESKIELQFFNKFKSLILAQNERWRYALAMQVERERVAIPE